MANTHKTTVSLRPKSVTLKKDDIREFCGILEKATEGDTRASLSFTLSGKGTAVSSESSEGLLNAKWPRDIDDGYLSARSYKNQREISMVFHNEALISYNRIDIGGTDSDWVAARSKGIQEFIADHRNYHWWFNSFWPALLQGVFLAGLAAYKLAKAISVAWVSAVVFGCSVLFFYVYVNNIGKLFPFTFIDTERPSMITEVRKVVKYAIPLIVGGLAIEFIARLLFG